jgi:hypothetical protein
MLLGYRYLIITSGCRAFDLRGQDQVYKSPPWQKEETAAARPSGPAN